MIATLQELPALQSHKHYSLKAATKVRLPHGNILDLITDLYSNCDQVDQAIFARTRFGAATDDGRKWRMRLCGIFAAREGRAVGVMTNKHLNVLFHKPLFKHMTVSCDHGLFRDAARNCAV